MARVPLVQDGDDVARATGIFGTFTDEGRDPSDIFRALANVPGLMMAHRALPLALRGQRGRAHHSGPGRRCRSGPPASPPRLAAGSLVKSRTKRFRYAAAS
jgi:hypothetical protein